MDQYVHKYLLPIAARVELYDMGKTRQVFVKRPRYN